MNNLKFFPILLMLTIIPALLVSQPVTRAVATHSLDQCETNIAVNPANPNILMAVYNDFSEGDTAKPGYAFSTDGGVSWSTGIFSRVGYYGGADPSCAIDRQGRAFYCYAASKTADDWRPVVTSTTDRGANWDTGKVLTSVGANDRPWLSVDNWGGSTDGRIHVTWHHYGIRYAYSTDGGISFTVYPETLSNNEHASSPKSGMITTGPDGNVYVVWDRTTGPADSLKFRRSTNGGQSFSLGPKAILGYNYSGDGDRFQYPVIAVSPANGNIFIAFIDNEYPQPGSKNQAKIIKSTDKGNTWSSPIAINSSETRNQYRVSVSASPDGRVHVTYIVHSALPDSNQYVYYSTSVDGGQTWQTPQLATEGSNRYYIEGGQYSGFAALHDDYMYMGSTIGSMYPIWTDFRNSHFPNPHSNTDVYIAQVDYFRKSASSFATASGSSSTTLYSGASSRWYSIYADNGDLYAMYSTNDGIHWLEGQKISGDLGGISASSSPILTSGPNDTLHVVFASGSNGLYYTKTYPTSSWITPVSLYEATDAMYPAFIVDGNGTGHVVFVEYLSEEDGGDGMDNSSSGMASESIPGGLYRLHYGTFTAASPGTLQIQKTITTSTYAITGVSITQISTGGIHAVWSKSGEIYYASGSGSSWSAPSNISSNAGISIRPSITNTSNQSNYTLYVVWQDNTSGNNEIYQRVYLSTNGYWWGTSNISNNSAESKYPTIRYSSYTGGTTIVLWSDNRDYSDTNNYDLWMYSSYSGTSTRLYATANASMYPNFTERNISGVTRLLPVWTESAGSGYRIASTYLDNPFGKRGMEARRGDKPHVYSLSSNYPNPFNPATTITYYIPENKHVTLKVYDLLGREIMTLVDEERSAGDHTVYLDSRDLASGVYLYSMQAGSFTETRKMLLIR